MITTEFLTKQEAADRVKVSVRTIERAIAAGDLEATGSGRLTRIRPEALEKWLELLRRRRGSAD